MTRFVACLWLSCALPMAAQTAVQPPAAYEVVGYVLDADTREPIPGVRVNLRWNGSGQLRDIALLTDYAGSLRVTNLPTGVMAVTWQRSGYLPAKGKGPINVMGPRSRIEFTRLLRKQVVIEGSVANQNGTSLRGATISALRLRVVEGRWQPVLASSAATDGEGRFRLARLPAGRYYLAINPVSEMSRSAYPAVFYPHATRLVNAHIFDLSSGQEEHLEIRLQGEHGNRVSGTLAVDSNSLSCNLLPDMDSLRIVQSAVGCTVDPKTHTFAIPNVPAGIYRFEAYWSDGQSHITTKTITVADRNVDGVVVTASPDKKLRGVVLQEGAPAPKISIQLTASWNSISAISEPDGTFAIPELLSGLLRVQVDRRDDVCVQSIHQGSRDVLRNGALIEDQDPDPLDIVLSSHCGVIRGAVDAVDATPMRPVSVAFFRQVDGDLVFDSQTSSTGNAGLFKFSSRSLAPGEYMVFAWATESGSFTQLPYAEPEFLREFGSLGVPITVRADEKAGISLQHLLPANAFAKD